MMFGVAGGRRIDVQEVVSKERLDSGLEAVLRWKRLIKSCSQPKNNMEAGRESREDRKSETRERHVKLTGFKAGETGGAILGV